MSRDSILQRMLLATFKERLFETKQPKDGRIGKGLAINFAGLHQMRLRKLQAELSQGVMQMHFNNIIPPDWETHMKEYVQAVRDYDYILRSKKSPYCPFGTDPFLLTNKTDAEASILKLELEQFSAEELDSRGENWSKRDIMRGQKGDSLTRDMAWTSQLWGFGSRLIMAGIAGGFLIGPMWLMKLDQGIITSLITTTTFTMACAVMIAALLRNESMTIVMSSTAAYAAVLVVFVGASNR